jgi:hypothetical protein
LEKSLEEGRELNLEVISTGLGRLPEETKHGASLAADGVKALLKEI